MNADEISKTINYTGSDSWLPGRTIFLTKHGSHAFGTNVATSDLDLKGIAIPTKEYFFGYLKNFEQYAPMAHKPDTVIYDLRKFISLAADCNPSIVEVLHTHPSDWLHISDLGEALVCYKDEFISKKAKHTFSGYATQQLKRIKGHYAWHRNPPKAPPTRAEFQLPERTIIPKDQLLAAEDFIKKKLQSWNHDLEAFDKSIRVLLENKWSEILTEMLITSDQQYKAAGRAVGLSENFIELLDRERGYNSKKRTWDQYQEWKKTRNPERAALEEKYGYDTKHGMHLVRLMRMCREILTTGRVIVKRQDAEELLAIRHGAWEYDKLVEWAEREDKDLDEVYKHSSLRHAPDRIMLDQLCINLVERSFG